MAGYPGFGALGKSTLEYSVFLSSADEVLGERKLFAELVDEINSALRLSDHAIRVAIRKWEELSGFKSANAVNDTIIDTSLAGAHLLVALLGKNLKPGTKQEVDYAMANGIGICIIILEHDTSSELTSYVDFLMASNVLVLTIERQQTSASALLLRSVLQPVLNAVKQPRAQYVEQR